MGTSWFNFARFVVCQDPDFPGTLKGYLERSGSNSYPFKVITMLVSHDCVIVSHEATHHSQILVPVNTYTETTFACTRFGSECHHGTADRKFNRIELRKHLGHCG